MLLELGALGIVLAGGTFGLARRRRGRLYEEQRNRIAVIRQTHGQDLGLARHAAPDFSRHLVRVPDFLPAGVFARLRDDILKLQAAERSFVPAHKKGGTIAYEALIERAPSVVAYYQSAELMGFFSSAVREDVSPTPVDDQSSLSVLVYDRPADRIGWHYDHDFYRGRHFTALLPIVNEGSAEGGLSHAELVARLDGKDVVLSTEPNTLVLFEGAVVRHKVTPIGPGERRIILSMTCCTDPRARLWQAIARRFKDTAYYGLRALWT
jgi:hypothetical protein